MKKLYFVSTEDTAAFHENKLQIVLTDKFLSMDFEGNHKRLATTYKHFVKAFEQATADGVIPAAIAKKAEEMINPYPNGKLAETRDKDGNLIFTQDGDQIFFGAGQEPDGTLDAVFDFDDDRDEGFYIWFKMNLENYADSIAAIEAATRAQEPPEGVSAAAPVSSIPPAEIAADAGKKNNACGGEVASTSTRKSNQGEDSMKQQDKQDQISKIGQADSTTDAAPMKTAVVTQQLKNLPEEILAQPRFFAVKENKAPKTKGWSKPENQKLYSEIRGLAGFDTAGHDVAADYLFLDFDHVLNDDGEFVNDIAAECFNRTQHYLNTYCELSASGHGIHIIAEPTAGKFKAVASGGDKGKIYFDAEKKSFLEIFYGTGGRYCLFTGNVFRCEPKTPIAHGEPVDGVFQALLDVIAKRAKKSTPAEKQKATKAQGMQEIPHSTLSADDKAYDLFRAQIMLDTINPAALSDTDWLAAISSCKNIGVPYPDVDAFNRRDPDRYDEQENLVRWDSVDDPSFDIETLHGIAKRFGYEERDARRQWFELHPELSTKISHRPAPMGGDDGKEKFVWTQDRIKSCPANLRLPADFTFSATGITQRVKSKKDTEDYKYLPVTKTPIVPTRIFFDPIKGTDEYEIAILSRGKWRRVEVEARILGDARALNMLCDYGALIIENSRLKNFFAAILAINPDLTEIKTYKQTGWTDSNFTTFAYPTGGEDYIVRRAGFDYKEDFKAKGNAELWKQKFKEVSEQGGAVARAFIGTALAAPLARPLNFLNPQAHLNGKSGSGKTALQKFVASIFGNPRKLIRTFAATNKNRLLVAAAYCDLPTFLDELETIQGKAAEEALSNDVYNFADGKGNQANRRDGTARETFEFGSSRLTTGERPILKQHDLRGAYKRLIQLDTTKGLFDDEFAADLHIFSESNFGHFGETWIRYIVANMGEIQKQYHFFAKFFIDDPTKKYEPTHLKSVAAAIVAFEFFSVAIGAKPEFEKFACIRNMRAIVDTLPDTAELDDTAHAIEALSSYIGAHEKSFIRDEKDAETHKSVEIGIWGTTCCGKIFDTGEVAFHPTELKRILEDELHFASADKLINEWKEQGNILVTEKGRATHVIKIGGKTYRTIHFKANIISTDSDAAEIKHYEELGAL